MTKCWNAGGKTKQTYTFSNTKSCFGQDNHLMAPCFVLQLHNLSADFLPLEIHSYEVPEDSPDSPQPIQVAHWTPVSGLVLLHPDTDIYPSLSRGFNGKLFRIGTQEVSDRVTKVCTNQRSRHTDSELIFKCLDVDIARKLWFPYAWYVIQDGKEY